jgi:hypothetical protein
VVGAVAGIVGDIQNLHTQAILNSIELNTRQTSILLGTLNGSGTAPQDADNLKGWMKIAGQTLQEKLPWIANDLAAIAVPFVNDFMPDIKAMTASLALIAASTASIDVKTPALKPGGAAASVVINVAGSVVGVSDLINTISSGLAAQTRVQGAFA